MKIRNAENKAEPSERILEKNGARAEILKGYGFLLLRVLLITAVCTIIFSRVLLVTQISGNEMYPAVKDGDLVICLRSCRDLAKNDLVIYEYDGKKHAGRIMALENDVVDACGSGVLTVNGTEQTGEIMFPTYAEGKLSYPHRVSAESTFILGDYRTIAHDSRERGDIPFENIQGKALFLLRRRGL